MKKNFEFSAAFKLVLMAGMASTLAACGGGSDAPPPVAVTPPPVITVPPPPPVSYAITMSGVAATGAAIANATVSAVCQSGGATATTAADGAFTVKVPAPAEGPCVLSVTNDDVVLRSIATGDGAKANITPLTEMLVSHIAVTSGAGAAATPAQLAKNANVKITVTNATMMLATANRVAAIVGNAAGVSVPNDFLSATLIPKSATNPGNALDAVLEAMKAKNVVNAKGKASAAIEEVLRKDAASNTTTGGTGGSG